MTPTYGAPGPRPHAHGARPCPPAGRRAGPPARLPGRRGAEPLPCALLPSTVPARPAPHPVAIGPWPRPCAPHRGPLVSGVRASEIARCLLRPASDLVGDAHAASLLALLSEPLGDHRLRSTGSLFVVRLDAFEERGQLVVVLAPRVVDVGRERPRVLERLLEHRHEVVVLVVGLAALSCHLGSTRSSLTRGLPVVDAPHARPFRVRGLARNLRRETRLTLIA